MIKVAKDIYYKKSFNEQKNDSWRTWQTINELVKHLVCRGRTDRLPTPSDITRCIHWTFFHYSCQTCNCKWNYFSNKWAQELSWISQHNWQCLILALTNSNQVLLLLNKLSKSKATGLDKISSRIILEYSKSVLSFSSLECLNYQAITTQNGRKNTYVSTTAICDNHLFGWHRFEAATGTKMPTSCVPSNRCNTHATGWLNGDHPTVAEGLVTRQVCFSYYDCCSWSINIPVRNCGDFYIYNFMGTPPEHPCHLRYCSTDWRLSDRVARQGIWEQGSKAKNGVG